jgi:hypothetical protein
VSEYESVSVGATCRSSGVRRTSLVDDIRAGRIVPSWSGTSTVSPDVGNWEDFCHHYLCREHGFEIHTLSAHCDATSPSDKFAGRVSGSGPPALEKGPDRRPVRR